MRAPGRITSEDYEEFKQINVERVSSLQAEIKDLQSEHDTMESMLEQAKAQAVDLVGAWEKGNVNQRQELAKSFFPEGLYFSEERKFFEPANTVITEMVMRFLDMLNEIGAPNGI